MEKEVQYRALALLKNGNSDYEYLADVTIRLPVDGTVAQLEDRVKKDLVRQRSEFRRPDDVLASILLLIEPVALKTYSPMHHVEKVIQELCIADPGFKSAALLSPSELLEMLPCKSENLRSKEFVHLLIIFSISPAVESPVAKPAHKRARSGDNILENYSFQASVRGSYKRGFVWGTPGSGKTTTLILVYERLRKDYPTSDIHLWTANEEKESWFRYFLDALGADRSVPYTNVDDVVRNARPTWFLLDDAQYSYEDRALWATFFKDYVMSRINKDVRVLVASSYRSQRLRFTGNSVPFDIPNDHAIYIYRQSQPHPDPNMSLALAFGLDECKAVIPLLLKRQNPAFTMPRIDESVCETIFWWTGGHVGAIEGIIQVLYCGWLSNRTDMIIDETRFEAICSTPAQLAEAIRKVSRGAFSRGVPRIKDFHDKPILRDMFHALIACSTIDACKEVARRHSDAVQLASNQGWLNQHVDDKDIWVFPSLLHRFIIAAYIVPEKPHIPFDRPLDLVLQVISAMRPSLLSQSERLPPRPGVTFCEDHWQSEFYRACSIATGSAAVYLSPQFTTFKDQEKQGRINFFVADDKKRWGIELLRDGSKIQAHYDRFTRGAYAPWLKNKFMTDFIVVDFRVMGLRQPHKECPNLIHVVFRDTSFTHYDVQDNMLNLVVSNQQLFETLE